MSLRSFHVIFIICSIILAVLFGCWAIGQYQLIGTLGYIWTAVASFLTAIALIIYEVMFLKKVRI